MCGLFGYSRTTRLTELMTPTLAIAMSGRGKDSWGVTDGETIYKAVGDIVDTFVDCGLEAPLYHTRAASIGAVSYRNAHPFKMEHEGRVVIGAHNGHLTNHWALKDKYARKDVEVDSEHIFIHLAENKPLSDFAGYGAVVWYEYPSNAPQDRVRYFSRFNHDALYFAKLKSGEIVFCSTKKAIDMAATLAGASIDFYYDTSPLVKYSIENDNLMQEGELDWAKTPIAFVASTVAGYGGGFNHFNGHSNWDEDRDKDKCPLNGCFSRISKEEFICKSHFSKLAADIYGPQS